MDLAKMELKHYYVKISLFVSVTVPGLGTVAPSSIFLSLYSFILYFIFYTNGIPCPFRLRGLKPLLVSLLNSILLHPSAALRRHWFRRRKGFVVYVQCTQLVQTTSVIIYNTLLNTHKPKKCNQMYVFCLYFSFWYYVDIYCIFVNGLPV